jgi:hypothetical protein
MSALTVIEILELLKPFLAQSTTSMHVRRQLKDTDIDALIDAERRKLVVTDLKQAAVPPVSTNVAERQYFHAVDRHGNRCFDDFVAKERARGIIAEDKGSPAFVARQSSGKCEGCGGVILEGDLIVIRQLKRTKTAE